ncbi:hypothetical protein ASPFODRAFT_287660 [Aspergillus luchuensis CBS 106.47]|uniref:Uncharacterized protein n=1 Tax=Aspergillus luchuensis (strain CBS 106.47) TaxID=1137211 RepID=A0A1M3TAN0_ASPLC|nr:hypothetical protein ASPFODRAFT_287660 [Aspergillus luchuensis CBS 106.47]
MCENMFKAIKYIFLPCLSILGFYTMWVGSAVNGEMEDFLHEIRSPRFSGSHYTGLPFIDMPLSIYIFIYRSVNDAAVCPESLQLLALQGGVGAILMLTALESYRTKPWDQVQKESLILGCSTMLLGANNCLPFYFAYSLTPAKPLRQRKNGPEKHPQSLLELQAFTLIFYYLPFISIGLPSYAALSPTFQDHAAVMMTFFPIMVAAATKFSAWLRHKRSRTGPSVTWSVNASYTLSIVCATVFHAIGVVGSIAIAEPQGSVVTTALSGVAETFIPYMQLKSPNSSRVKQLVFVTFQWDYIIAALATVLWSMALYIDACRQARVKVSPTKLCLSLLFESLIIGPFAASASLIMKKGKVLEHGLSVQKEH